MRSDGNLRGQSFLRSYDAVCGTPFFNPYLLSSKNCLQQYFYVWSSYDSKLIPGFFEWFLITWYSKGRHDKSAEPLRPICLTIYSNAVANYTSLPPHMHVVNRRKKSNFSLDTLILFPSFLETLWWSQKNLIKRWTSTKRTRSWSESRIYSVSVRKSSSATLKQLCGKV